MNQRILTVSYIAPYNRKEMPLIRIQGRWLEKLGFTIGKKIIVKEKYDKLIILIANQEGVENK